MKILPRLNSPLVVARLMAVLCDARRCISAKLRPGPASIGWRCSGCVSAMEGSVPGGAPRRVSAQHVALYKQKKRHKWYFLKAEKTRARTYAHSHSKSAITTTISPSCHYRRRTSPLAAVRSSACFSPTPPAHPSFLTLHSLSCYETLYCL